MRCHLIISLSFFALFAVPGVSAAQFVPLPGYTKSVIYASDYGVVGDGSSNNNTALQNAINACATFPASGKGCILHLPCGQINVSTGFTVNHGIIIQACGGGFLQVPPPDPSDNGGTVLKQTCTTCNTFLITTIDPVQIRDIGFDGPFNATAGSWIYIRPVPSPTANPNRHSVVSNVTSVGGYTFLSCELCGNYTFRDNAIYGFAGHGIYLTGSPSLSDSGDATIIGNTIGPWPGVAFPAGDCIVMLPHGGIRVISNKLLGCVNGIHVAAYQGRTGTLIIQGNSIEETQTNHIRVEQWTSGVGYGNIIISGNQMQNLTTASFQGSIVFVAGAQQYIDYVTISGNVIVNGYSGGGTPFASASCMQIQDGNFVMINNNFCQMNNVSSWVGIAVNSRAINVSVLDNSITGTPGGRYVFEVMAKFRDTISGLTTASLPANVADGGQAFVTDGAPGTACAGGSSGSMGFKQGGAWKCF